MYDKLLQEPTRANNQLDPYLPSCLRQKTAKDYLSVFESSCHLDSGHLSTIDGGGFTLFLSRRNMKYQTGKLR